LAVAEFILKEMQHIILCTHVHACSPSYTDEELKYFSPFWNSLSLACWS